MAALTSTNSQISDIVTPAKIAVGTSGDTLAFASGAAQDVVLFNNSASSVNVTIKGNSATTVKVPGCGSSTKDVSTGLVVAVPANSFILVPLDAHSGYLAGTTVSITAATAGVVYACLVS